jgi:hypothetical protein
MIQERSSGTGKIVVKQSHFRKPVVILGESSED